MYNYLIDRILSIKNMKFNGLSCYLVKRILELDITSARSFQGNYGKEGKEENRASKTKGCALRAAHAIAAQFEARRQVF